LILTSESKTGPPKKPTWNDAKKMMNNPQQFLDSLKDFKKEEIPPANITALEPYLSSEEFTPEVVETKSSAAAGLCSWVINIVKYFKIFCEVEPKRIKTEEKKVELEKEKDNLSKKIKEVQSLEAEYNKLIKQLEEAKQELKNLEEKQRKTTEKIELAGRLVNGLGDENVRWAESIKKIGN